MTAKPTIQVTWYNHVTETAGEFLTKERSEAISHAIAALHQGSDIHIRDHLTGVSIEPSTNPSVAVLCTIRQLQDKSIAVRSDGTGNFPMGVTARTLWSAVAHGLATITRPVGDTRIVHISNAGRKLLGAAA